MSEITHKLPIDVGMQTLCKMTIKTTFDKKGKPSYEPKYSLYYDDVNCVNCIKIADKIKNNLR